MTKTTRLSACFHSFSARLPQSASLVTRGVKDDVVTELLSVKLHVLFMSVHPAQHRPAANILQQLD